MLLFDKNLLFDYIRSYFSNKITSRQNDGNNFVVQNTDKIHTISIYIYNKLIC